MIFRDNNDKCVSQISVGTLLANYYHVTCPLHKKYANSQFFQDMRNRDPHYENVGNILAICLSIMTMQLFRESPSASHAMRKSAWNVHVPVLNQWGNLNDQKGTTQEVHQCWSIFIFPKLHYFSAMVVRLWPMICIRFL